MFVPSSRETVLHQVNSFFTCEECLSCEVTFHAFNFCSKIENIVNDKNACMNHFVYPTTPEVESLVQYSDDIIKTYLEYSQFATKMRLPQLNDARPILNLRPNCLGPIVNAY